MGCDEDVIFYAIVDNEVMLQFRYGETGAVCRVTNCAGQSPLDLHFSQATELFADMGNF
jgi:hypothetical protein